MVKRLLLALLCLIPYATSAQSDKLEIIVSEATANAGIASAIVTSHDHEGRQIGYQLTNNSGIAYLPIFKQLHKIKVRKMGYEDKEIVLPDLSKKVVHVVLEEKIEMLPEFVFRIPAIERKNDTIVYNASAFITTQDTYLRDLLEKLPGVRINESGIVYYQGEPIKRFYVEGKDLLGSQYALATNNLSVDAISRVEVLERFQDVKVLQGVVPEERSSMNIILKEDYKVRPFGYLDGGIGYEPILYESRANATKVSKSPLQYYIYASADNYNTENADAALNINVSELNSLVPQKGKLSSTGIGGKPIDAKHYIQNKSWKVSTNGLLSFSEDVQLRINLKGYYDWMGQGERQIEHYKELSINLDEQSNSHNNQIEFKPILSYELNSHKKHLSNKLIGDISRSNGFRHVLGGNRELKYMPQSDNWWIQNNLETTFALNKDRSLLGNFYSKLLYGETTDRLGADRLDDPLSQSEWQADHGFSTYFSLPRSARLSLSLEDHIYYRRYQVGRLNTRVTHNELEISPKLILSFYQKRGSITLGTDIRHTSQRIAQNTNNLWDFSPTLHFTYKGKTGWDYILSSSLRSYIPLASSYFPIAYRLSHKAESMDYLESYRAKQWNVYTRANYSNLINYFFATLSLRYVDTRNPIVWDISLSQDGITTISALLHQGHSRSITGEVKADKSFTDHGINVVFEGLINLTSSPSSLNKSVTQGYYRNYMAEVGLSYGQIKWFTLSGKISYKYRQAWRDLRNDWYKSSQVNGDLSALFALSKQFSMAWRYDWVYFTREENRELQDFHLLGLSLDWKVSKKIKLMLECNNILNSDEYVIKNNNPIVEQTTILQLRPRSIFLKAHWAY